MRKFFVVSIPIVALAIFICIMLSASILKKPLGNDDNIPKNIENIIEAVNNEDWKKASNETEALNKAWKKVMFRVQFSSERDKINYLSTNISRLRGAIEVEDRVNALLELYEAYNHWRELGE